MATTIDAILAAIMCLCMFISISMLGYLLIMLRRDKSPCEGCKYYVKDGNKCLFNPVYGYPVPKQCTREEWDI